MTTRDPRSIRYACVLAIALLALPSSPARRGEAAEAVANARTSVTFTRDIAPLIFQRCATCHRPGEVAPFPLLSYRDVSKRADLITSVTGERTMPPWKAEPGFGHFADERRLTDDQIAMIARWASDGAPEGDPADLPPMPHFTEGWQLGEPDQVVTMPEPYSLDAEGPDVYRCFVIPLQIPSGKYLKAVEYRPGTRRIVHHAVLSTLPHRVAQAKLDAGDGKSFASGLAPPGQLLPGQLAFWTPGMLPRPLPDEYAADWPQGADLVLQLHLHPSGKPETEQSSIGLHFTDQKPVGRLKMLILNNDHLDIPAGDGDFAVEASRTLQTPIEIHGVFPHMHLIGRSVKVIARLPDGTTEPVISINDWDFNWQHYYRYATPLRLPAGTRLEGHFTYDNSASNPANPSQPPKRVTFGEQTADEMAIVILDGIPTGPAPNRPSTARVDDPAALAKRAGDTIRMLDRDGNGKLNRDEISTVMGARELPAEIERKLTEFDRDGDKQLDLSEVTETLKALGKR